MNARKTHRYARVRTAIRVAAVGATWLVVVTGCASPVSRPTPSAPVPKCAGSPRELLQRFTDAFNDHDAPALAALFTENATFVNIYGQVMEGRVGIEEGHRRAFDSRLTVADLVMRDVDEHSLGADDRLLYGHWRLAQPATADPSASVPSGSGILTAIARCTAGDWRLRAATNVRETTPPS